MDSEIDMVFIDPTLLWGDIFLMILKTFGDMGWKGAQDGVRGEFLRWFPPYSVKGLWEADPGRFPIDSGISSDMVITDRNSLWGVFPHPSGWGC